MTRKAQYKATDYNETVYTLELGKILSHLRGLDNLNHAMRHKRTPTSLLNPEIILPEAAFQVSRGENTGWLDEESWDDAEKVEPYEYDWLQTRVDWCGDPEELVRMKDAVDQKDHESMYLEDYPEDMPDLEETMSTGTSIYDRLGATPANTMMSTNMEAAGDMFNLSMGPPEMPEPHWQDEPDTSHSSIALSDDEQFNDMFKVPCKVPECRDQVPIMQSGLNFRALMAEAQFKSDRRVLPPPPELRLHCKDDKDTRNMELQAKTSKNPEVPVANPRNKDPLDLDRDANWDAVLEHMRERRQKESCSSSTASRSSSTSKRHRSASWSGDEINPKKGCPTPNQEHLTPDKGNTPPHQESLAPACKFTLNWDQDILEPMKPKWRPAAKDAPATPQHKVKSVVNPDSAAPTKIASCGKGRGWVITEKLKEIAMGPAVSSWYTGKDDIPKKMTPKTSSFPTREEMEACKRHEAWKDRVVNHQEESIGKWYFSIKQQASQFAQEVKALRFFEPEGKETDLAYQVIAMADWAVEYNELSNHPLPVIPPELQILYSSPRHGKGQFPLAPTLEESSSTDVRIQCQARWTYLCAILQYFEDDMPAREGALYGGRICQPSTLILYIMEHVNPGLPEHFWVEWSSIVGSTPWLIAWSHMSQEELDRFYSEPLPTVVSDLEVAMEEVYDWECQDSAWRTGSDQPIPPSRAEDTPRDLPDMPPQVTREAHLSPTEEWPHKFIPDSNWTLITGSQTGTGQSDSLLVAQAQVGAPGELAVLTDLEVELGAEDVWDVLNDYLTEDAVAVRDLLLSELGLTGGESMEILEATEAMEVDLPMMHMAKATHLPMDTGQSGVLLGTFQPELTGPGCTPSLIGSMDTPLSPITAEDNALLDITDPGAQTPEISKAPGAGRPEGSPSQGSPSKPRMTLRKRKPPPTWGNLLSLEGWETPFWT